MSALNSAIEQEIAEKQVTNRFQFRGGRSVYSNTSRFVGRTATCLRNNRHALAALSIGRKACTAAHIHTGRSRRREIENNFIFYAGDGRHRNRN